MSTPLIVEKTFNASPSIIWEALTNNNELKKWYFQLEEFKAEKGFEFSFAGGPENGPQYIHRCEILDVVPGRKLSYSWRYEGLSGDSVVTWELEPQNDQTHVRIIHTGLESLENNGPDFARSSFNGGWNYFLNEALNNYLEENNTLK